MSRTQRASATAPSQPPEAAKAAAAESDLAYRMQRWPRLLFRQETESGGFIEEALAMRKEGTWPAVCRELFGRLYGTGTSKLDETPQGNEWAEELHQQADAVPEWKLLEERVRGDAWRSAMGAGQVAAVLSQHMPELPEENAGAMQAEADMMRELMEGGRVNTALLQQRGELQKRIAASREAGKAASGSMQAANGFAIRSVLRKASQQATEAIEQCEGGMQGMGVGSAATPAERRALMLRMASDDRLRRIAVLAGRLRIQAARKQRTKSTQERSEIVSVKQGDDLQHLVASEVGMLALPASRPFVLERIAEKRALVYELGGKTTKARGPLVFLIDASGSMDGHREEWAKACAMALMEIARIQRRPFAVVFFDGGLKHSTFFAAGEASTEKILDVMGVNCTGGTNIGQALAYAERVVACDLPETATWKAGKDADVVLLTDGADHSDKQTPCDALKARGASIYTVCVECACPDDLRAVSVEVVSMSPRDMAAASPKLDGVFSM